MMEPMQAPWIIGFLVGSYLLGSVPFAYLIARAQGVDIRAVGSGNVGATNVARVLGLGWGVVTFVLDAAKGFLPTVIGPWWYGGGNAAAALPPWLGLACGAAAVAGHVWPVWLGFRGGKGVATCAGVLLGVAPGAAVAGAVVWGLMFAARRIVSLASILAAIAVPLAGWLLYGTDELWRPWALTTLGTLVVWRHRSNLRRLLDGTEPRSGAQPTSPKGA